MSVSAIILLKKELYAVYGAEKLQQTVVLNHRTGRKQFRSWREEQRDIFRGRCKPIKISKRDNKAISSHQTASIPPTGASIRGGGVFWPASLLVTGAHKEEVHRGGSVTSALAVKRSSHSLHLINLATSHPLLHLIHHSSISTLCLRYGA
jgi:hypothetical protein